MMVCLFLTPSRASAHLDEAWLQEVAGRCPGCLGGIRTIRTATGLFGFVQTPSSIGLHCWLASVLQPLAAGRLTQYIPTFAQKSTTMTRGADPGVRDRWGHAPLDGCHAQEQSDGA